MGKAGEKSKLDYMNADSLVRNKILILNGISTTWVLFVVKKYLFKKEKT